MLSTINWKKILRTTIEIRDTYRSPYSYNQSVTSSLDLVENTHDPNIITALDDIKINSAFNKVYSIQYHKRKNYIWNNINFHLITTSWNKSYKFYNRATAILKLHKLNQLNIKYIKNFSVFVVIYQDTKKYNQCLLNKNTKHASINKNTNQSSINKNTKHASINQSAINQTPININEKKSYSDDISCIPPDVLFYEIKQFFSMKKKIIIYDQDNKYDIYLWVKDQLMTSNINTHDLTDVFISKSVNRISSNFVDIWKLKPSNSSLIIDQYYIYERLKKLLGYNIYRCPNGHYQMINKVEQLAAQNVDDETIYTELRILYHTVIKPSYEYNRIRNRNNIYDREQYHVNQIIEILPRNYTADSILDIGCAEGKTVALLGQKLQVHPTNVHGCDIRPIPTTDQNQNMIFTVCAGDTLPYDTNQFDLILMLMSLHHVENVDKLLNNVFKVLKNNGLLLIREHDCPNEAFASLLDIQHGLYARVWPEKEEMLRFCGNYLAYYRTQSNWTKKLNEHGFVQHQCSPDRRPLVPQKNIYTFHDIKNPMNTYYGLYRKK